MFEILVECAADGGAISSKVEINLSCVQKLKGQNLRVLSLVHASKGNRNRAEG
jgi:hypothetical protein